MEEQERMEDMEEGQVVLDMEDLVDLENMEGTEGQQKTSLSSPPGQLLPLTVLRAWPRQPRRRFPL